MFRHRYALGLAAILTVLGPHFELPTQGAEGRGGGGSGRGGQGSGGRNSGGRDSGRSGGGNQRGGSPTGHSPSFSQPRSSSGMGDTNRAPGGYQQPSQGGRPSNTQQPQPRENQGERPGTTNPTRAQATPNAGAAATGAAVSNRNQPGVSNAGAAATGAAVSNRNQPGVSNAGAAATGAAVSNRNQPGISNAGAAATGAAYANRNQPGISNAGAAATGAAYANRNNESNYHAGVVNGYWNRNAAPGWGTAAAVGAAGVGLGYAGGVAAWGTGSPVYNWGYSGYNNPYYAGMGGVGAAPGQGQPIQGGAQAQPAYNYSQPLNTNAAPPDQTTADPANSLFAQAREAFNAGNTAAALDLDQQAIKLMPNDATLHEFLALVQFAEGKYDQAAAGLYAVLSVGPGWDWTTLVGMYNDVETYTKQLRALEAFVKQNPKSNSAQFVLAYHYITQGHDKAAVSHLKTIVASQPEDTLSAQLIKQLEPSESATAPAPTPVTTAPVADMTKLTGTWVAKALPDAKIQLTIKNDGSFSWSASAPGKPPISISGQSSFDGTVLSLNGADAQTGSIAGSIAWKDDNHFQFRAVGGPTDDPGLTFER